jgi:hypothetical protein
MGDDSNSQGGNRTADLPHPDSPSGRQLNWASSTVPHPDSPSGQRFDWSVLDLPHPHSPFGDRIGWEKKRDKLLPEVAELEDAVKVASAKLRKSIPDNTIRALYDRLMDRIHSTYVPASVLGTTSEDGEVLVEKLGRPILWFDPGLQRKVRDSAGFVVAADRIGPVWEFGTVKERKELLKNVESLLERVYQTAADGITHEWVKAKRSGKQQELIQKWKNQLLREIKKLDVGGVEVLSDPAASKQAQASAEGAKGAKAGGAGTSNAKEKHWIGVKVVDETGKPVKDVTVQCKLDDGTVLTMDVSASADGSYKTEKVLDAAKGDFSFSSLYNVEWWPEGGSGGKSPSGTPAAAVAPGDCVLSIADSLGFRNYHSVWDQPQNDALKKDRPNPNMLASGDVVQTPDKKDKVVKKAVDQTWIFVVRRKRPFTLRLVLYDKNDKPLSGKAWELKTPLSQKGTTGGDGLIEITGLQPSDKTGTLEVTMAPAKPAPARKPAPPATPAANPTPYPPPIVPQDFKDKLPAPDTGPQIVTWNISIGALPAVKVKEGTLARLHNLGFGCDVNSDDAHATRAVKAYQLFYLKAKDGSGKIVDIQDDTAKRHDN